MISIRKYLDSAGRKQSEKSEPASFKSQLQFSGALLEAIQRDVLTGEGFDALRSQITDLRSSVSEQWKPEEELAAEDSVKRILSEYRATVQRSGAHQAVEIQHIFATLNQALIVMSEGNDRTVSRLNTVQGVLRQACMLDDIVALKSSLTAAVEFVKSEAVHAREAAALEVTQFSSQLTLAREFVGNTRGKMLGRSEGVALITECLGTPGDPTFVVGYLCDRLAAVAQRYGPPIADELMFHLINERVRPITPDGAVFRWNPFSILTAFRSTKDMSMLRNKVTELNRTPLLHRFCLGGRTAVLTMAPAQFIAQGIPGEAGDLIEQADRFAQIGQGSGK